jgi:hypothetical protein
VEAWCKGTGIGFVIGSPYHNYRWWHRAFNRLALYLNLSWEWEPPEDPTVLELHPPDPREDSDGRWYWTTVRPGDVILPGGIVRREECER